VQEALQCDTLICLHDLGRRRHRFFISALAMQIVSCVGSMHGPVAQSSILVSNLLNEMVYLFHYLEILIRETLIHICFLVLMDSAYPVLLSTCS
jgi:hypothetical protein